MVNLCEAYRGTHCAEDDSVFITLGSKPYLIRHNNRLPIVVYAPEGAKVHYRVWTVGVETKVVEKG
jgi:ecotin